MFFFLPTDVFHKNSTRIDVYDLATKIIKYYNFIEICHAVDSNFETL